MKKWLSVAAIVVLCLALAVGVSCGEGEEEEGVTELKFGWGVPLSGIIGSWIGVPGKYAASSSAEDIGEFEVGGKIYRWKPIFEDNQMTAEGGMSSATKFVYEDDVDFMFQLGQEAALVASEICEETGIVLDVAAVTIDAFGPERPHMFQVAATHHLTFSPFIDWLSREHPEVEQVVLMVSEDLTGESYYDAISRACDYYGIKCDKVATPSGTMEYYPAVTKVLSYEPDLVMASMAPQYDPLWELGYEGLIFNMSFSEEASGAVDWEKAAGKFLVLGPHAFAWPEAIALKAEFEERYNVEFSPASFYVYAILDVYTEALKQAGTVDDTDKIIETLETGTFDIIVGPVHFGGKAINGYGHCLVWPCPIMMITGEREYEQLAYYTAEEAEEVANQVYR